MMEVFVLEKELEGSYNGGVKDDPRLYLPVISFVNFEAHLGVCIENVLYK